MSTATIYMDGCVCVVCVCHCVCVCVCVCHCVCVCVCSGSWKTKSFKPYNFDALGVSPSCGYLHPLMKVRTEIRQIFLEMG